jgi:hypothetical protein
MIADELPDEEMMARVAAGRAESAGVTPAPSAVLKGRRKAGGGNQLCTPGRRGSRPGQHLRIQSGP